MNPIHSNIAVRLPMDGAAADAASVTYQPSVDIVHTNDELLIFADLPGAVHDGIEVSFERGVLELRARVARNETSRDALLEEVRVGDFQRAFRLPDDFDGSATRAEVRDGVLTLRIPKAQSARAQRIEIQAGRG
ncbi:MAG TPA: Hsp20/alpha crystallin family protein [Planctomycetota bacterium]|nr:Hsp20/alpha crystallin family protein [Planctomycetota bacterium]